MKKNFYITTTLPYVNSDPHIGFAMEIIRADIIARNRTEQGDTVFFNTGTDEHGLKIYQNAVAQKVSPQEYVDGFAQKFKDLLPLLDIAPTSENRTTNFIRTTDAHHIKAAQEFWKVCAQNGFIEKATHKIKYCVGCELEKTESELVESRCPLHPNRDIDTYEEENYFFKFSKFGDSLLKKYKEHEARGDSFVVPQERFGEIKSFVEGGLNDFSISRLASKMPWGIPVPGDEKHVMYVWFDALVNYISAVGWPHNMEQFNEVWNGSGGVVQYCGKDNLRQQAAMWQAMLMAAGITPSQKIIINGFIMSNGQKMSKSLGNVISPFDLVRDYGVDAVRYFVAQELHPFEDSDVTPERLLQAYNAGLANGLGNLASRVMKMAETHGVSCGSEGAVLKNGIYEAKNTEIQNCFARYNIMQATSVIWQIIQDADKFIQLEQPFKKVKVDAEAAKKDIAALVFDVQAIGKFLKPVMPQTSQKILDCVAAGKTPATPLFVRK